jgi:hypothetical protein
MSFPHPTQRRRVPRAPIPTGPVGGLSDPRFRYVPGVATDIRKTLRRAAAQIAKGAGLHPGAGA